MNHGSLFSGIGGFDLAAQWAGWRNVFQCEIDPWCQKVLAKNFPTTKRYGDIKQFNASEWRGRVDIISGGFPCQPYSTAGKRLGKQDERHLWPEMLRIIREASPTWVVGENVRGLVSWSDGLVFDEVCTDLEAAGYEVQAYILPAASVGAPHRRDRVWFIAHADKVNDRRDAGKFSASDRGQGSRNLPEFTCPNENEVTPNSCSYGHKLRGHFQDRRTSSTSKVKRYKWKRFWGNVGRTCEQGVITNANTFGREGQQRQRTEAAKKKQPFITTVENWDDWTIEPPVCGMDDGIPNRVDRLAGLGNAVVPQLVLKIFEAINSFQNEQ